MRTRSQLSDSPGSRRRRLCGALLLVLLAVLPASAAAQDGSARPAVPEDLEQAISDLKKTVSQEPDNVLARFRLASLLAAAGRFEEAGPIFAAVVARDPKNSAARRGEITALLLQGRYQETRRKLEEGLQELPQDGQLAHTLARILATAPVDEVRDGEMALALASRVWEVKKIYETGETVAMALAEAGRFERAVEFQRGLIEQAEAAGESSRIEGLRQRLLKYLGNEAWRAESPIEIATATEPPQLPSGG